MHVRSVKKSSTFVICTVELAQIDDFWEIYYEHEFVCFFFSQINLCRILLGFLAWHSHSVTAPFRQCQFC